MVHELYRYYSVQFWDSRSAIVDRVMQGNKYWGEFLVSFMGEFKGIAKVSPVISIVFSPAGSILATGIGKRGYVRLRFYYFSLKHD